MKVVTVGERPCCLEDLWAVAHGEAHVALPGSASFSARLAAGVAHLERGIAAGDAIYGVTTGYGASCTTAVPPELVAALPANLVRFHGCGAGDPLTQVQARAVCAARLVALAQGMSAVRRVVLERLVWLLNHDVMPLMPQEGSVGASGDLTPLSYLAAALMGERQVRHAGEVGEASDLLARRGLEPLALRPKEALALMNGTSMMTGLACLAWQRAAYLARLASRITALNVAALQGNAQHFDARLLAAKPHPGPQQVAAWLRADLGTPAACRSGAAVQDRYSLRCAPHVIGVLVDSLPWLRQFIENEINSANDNPLVDPSDGQVLHGGHFYGGHIAAAMDGLKAVVAGVADLLDRQLLLLCDPRTNEGLPPNLSGASPATASIHHGFKGVQVAVSAWTAEALKLTMPASVFSRSTECHNQDKVSMGSIAARDCLRIIALTEQVAAACLAASSQAIRLRERQAPCPLAPEPRAMLDDLGTLVPLVEEDRALELELRALTAYGALQRWPLYE